jgi:hypothetical protein
LLSDRPFDLVGPCRVRVGSCLSGHPLFSLAWPTCFAAVDVEALGIVDDEMCDG